jgi:hypothetical protein
MRNGKIKRRRDGNVVDQCGHACPLNARQAESDADIRLQEIHGQTKREIREHEQLENIAIAMRPAHHAPEERGQDEQRTFVP